MSSPVIKWPDATEVVAALRGWVDRQAQRSEVVKLGYFGSYARGDWGVGSDVDLVAVVRDDRQVAPFDQRAAGWDVTALPVPAELLVYTESEWNMVISRPDRFARTLQAETVWLLNRSS